MAGIPLVGRRPAPISVGCFTRLLSRPSCCRLVACRYAPFIKNAGGHPAEDAWRCSMNIKFFSSLVLRHDADRSQTGGTQCADAAPMIRPVESEAPCNTQRPSLSCRWEGPPPQPCWVVEASAPAMHALNGAEGQAPQIAA